MSLTPFPHCSKFFELEDIQGKQNSTMHPVKESIHNHQVHTAVKSKLQQWQLKQVC